MKVHIIAGIVIILCNTGVSIAALSIALICLHRG